MLASCSLLTFVINMPGWLIDFHMLGCGNTISKITVRYGQCASHFKQYESSECEGRMRAVFEFSGKIKTQLPAVAAVSSWNSFFNISR